MPGVTVALYLTDPEGIGYAEYENAEHTIFMFEPEFLSDKFGEIPAFLTITVSAGQEATTLWFPGEGRRHRGSLA